MESMESVMEAPSVLETVSDTVPEVTLDALAARVRTEHTAAGTALKDSLAHAMAAGDALVEAKEKLAHGQWLPWLQDNCSISERTAQLYMRVSKNRKDVEEEQNRNATADLSLNEAAALLVLSSDVRKLFAFVRQSEHCDPEELVKVCIEQGVGLISDAGYDPFAGRDNAAQREWIAFISYLVIKCGLPVDDAVGHVEWVCQRPFQNVDEWLGDAGDNFRRYRCLGVLKPIPEDTKAGWKAFFAERASFSSNDFEEEALRIDKGRPIPVRRSRSRSRRRRRHESPGQDGVRRLQAAHLD